eukprot:COSAG04_NODE_2220_length_4505_cov_9.015887_2_plen_97_part_00
MAPPSLAVHRREHGQRGLLPQRDGQRQVSGVVPLLAGVRVRIGNPQHRASGAASLEINGLPKDAAKVYWRPGGHITVTVGRCRSRGVPFLSNVVVA